MTALLGALKAPVILTLACLMIELGMQNHGNEPDDCWVYLAKQMMEKSNFHKTSGHRHAEKMDPLAHLRGMRCREPSLGSALTVPRVLVCSDLPVLSLQASLSSKTTMSTSCCVPGTF